MTNQVLETIKARRSIRAFTKQNISRENLELLTEAARYAPSGFNQQTWKFTVVQRPEMLKKLANAIAKELDRGEDYCFYHANVIILASNERDNHLGIQDCACALENIFLAAQSLGIGSVWINQLSGICDVPEIRLVLNELRLPKNHIVLGMAALGYAAAPGRPANKREDVVEWIL